MVYNFIIFYRTVKTYVIMKHHNYCIYSGKVQVKRGMGYELIFQRIIVGWFSRFKDYFERAADHIPSP